MIKTQKYIAFFAIAFAIALGFNFHSQIVRAALPVCSDFIDNDGDGLIDIADPQCHTDGDASNPGTWDEFGTSERSLIPPVVDAGPNVTITLPTSSVASAATASDADGTIVTYTWTLVSGPAGSTLSSPATLLTNYDSLVAGVYVFKIEVTDNDGLTANDTMQITVNPTAPGGGGGGGAGGGCLPGSLCSFPTPTAPVVVAPAPVGQVLGATTDTCGTNGRPCVLQKTGGVEFDARVKANRKAIAQAMKEGNSISIPKIGVNKPVIQSDTIKTLRGQLWILPWTSTPDKGGNTVLVGHSYSQVKNKFEKSVLYDLEKLEKGDNIEMMWKGKKYTYTISEKGTAKPEDYNLEDQTGSPMLTIYGCGRNDNTYRNYIKAELVPEKAA